MARSQKDDPLYGDMQHHPWNYRADGGGAPGQPPLPPGRGDNMFTNPSSFAANSIYLNKHPYGASVAPDNIPKHDDGTLNNMQGMPRSNNMPNYGTAVLNLGNGQMVRVYYDENNKQIMIPVTSQYELFSQNQQSSQPPHIFSINQEYSMNNNVRTPQPTTASQNTCFSNDNMQSSMPTSNFLKEVLGNWEPNSSGTYSPFGQNYPLNHPDAPLIHNHSPVVDLSVQTNTTKLDSMPKRNENSPLADLGTKKRIVAEVKPMRPSYSDVLAKNTKINSQPDVASKTKIKNVEAKPNNKTINSKPEKQNNGGKHYHDEQKQKHENKKLINTASSGSESGDFTYDDNEKRPKPNKRSRNKQNNRARKWSSLEDITKEDESYNPEGNSQFMFIENQTEKSSKKEKKNDKSKNLDKHLVVEDDFIIEDDDEEQFELQESHGEVKARKRKDGRGYSYKCPKPQDKKKPAQSKCRRAKPGLMGAANAILDRWWRAARLAAAWLLYLVGDVGRMSGHLALDLFTSFAARSVCVGLSSWSWASGALRQLADNKYLKQLDKKLGHTRFGFWRKIKWFKKDVDPDDEDSKLDANIPLPATGEEAMKRLLACKGKDPYSILGVSPNCTDGDIRRHYRRQAFLVHPDKNTQPGAEEAFKILQRAFDLIGEPERRAEYAAAAAESAHAAAAWSELGDLLAQLHDKMERAQNTIRCTNCGRRHKREATSRPCYAARYCATCKIRHSAKEGDIWAESRLAGLVVMYYACMDGAVYQITQWASCQKKNLRQLKPDCHLVQYRIVLGSRAQAQSAEPPAAHHGHEPTLEEFLNNLYGAGAGAPAAPRPEPHSRRRARRPN